MHQVSERVPRTAKVIALLTIASALVATGASAIDIRGTIASARDYGAQSQEEASTHYWDEWNGFVNPGAYRFDPSRELAVVLVGGDSSEMASDQPGFMIANGGLSPSTLVVRPGIQLEIANSDPCSHELFAEGQDAFTALPTAPGLQRRVDLAETPGHFEIADRLYSHVRGHLHLLPNLVARAAVAGDGSFVFRGVQPGTYTLKIFHGADEVHSGSVQVTDQELTIDPIRLINSAEEG